MENKQNKCRAIYEVLQPSGQQRPRWRNPHTAIQFFMKSKIGEKNLNTFIEYAIKTENTHKNTCFCVVFHIIQLVRKGFEIPQVLPDLPLL